MANPSQSRRMVAIARLLPPLPGSHSRRIHDFRHRTRATGKAPRGMPSATVLPMPTLFPAHSSEAPFCPLAPETGSTLLLQGNRQPAITHSVCVGHCRDLQGRQWTLAGKLLEHPRKPCRRRYLQSLLPGGKSPRRGVDLRERAHRNGATAAANLLQEFVVRKLTPSVPRQSPAQP
jgi:hypothetical protein